MSTRVKRLVNSSFSVHDIYLHFLYNLSCKVDEGIFQTAAVVEYKHTSLYSLSAKSLWASATAWVENAHLTT